MTATELTARKYELLARINALPEVDPRLDSIAGVLDMAAPVERMESLRMFTLVQAAKAIGTSVDTLRRCVADGRLKLVEIRSGVWRVTENELRRWMGAR